MPTSSFRPGMLVALCAAGAALTFAACAGSSTPAASSAGGPAPIVNRTTGAAPQPDPRVGLRAGFMDAGEAIWNMRKVSTTPPPEPFLGVTNSDLAFSGQYVIQGNYNGFQVWDVSNPARPTLTTSYLCPASQSDVSVYRNLLFVSGEGLGGRLDCGTQGVPDSVSLERLRGIRIFDITDIRNPRYVANVQTCRGSHTHTVATDPGDPAHVYVYVSGSAGVRPSAELPGCIAEAEDEGTALFRIEVIKVPLAAPERAAIVSSPRIFTGLDAAPRRSAATDTTMAPRGGRGGRGGQAPPRPTGPTQCHDITVYPEVGLAGGACGGYGLLLDISDVANPRRIDAVADTNFAFWHSATFSNDGSMVLFTDEWGGGRAPRCRASDRYEWGANAIFTIENGRMRFKSYYKMPAPQTAVENCVAHNGSLIPIPGREIKVQAWYQGGVSIFEWTDPANPVEIAYHDRGPLDASQLTSAGPWSTYWHNGLIYSSEIARGLDIFELVPSGFISQNEIDAAKTVRFDFYNPQEQKKFVWPPSFALARAYLDQLERSSGLSGTRISSVRSALADAERASGAQRRSALSALATQLDQDAGSARDAAKVRTLSQAVRDLSAQ